MVLLRLLALLFFATGAAASAQSKMGTSVAAVLNAPDEQLDYARAANEFEKLVNPTAGTAATNAMIARLVEAAQQMAGPEPTDAYKLAAVRKAIYDAGPWNYNRPFQYDQSDPLGLIIRNKLLSTYIETRQGNCVSMPVLFLIVADRMGLNVHLATAPLHVFVRYTDGNGVEKSLEATSGASTTRTQWYREKLPMTDRSVESGIYMRTLSKRESIAVMATMVVEFLLDQHRYQEAIDVADAILAVNPRDAYTIVKRGTAIEGLLRTEFFDKYATPALIPPPLRVRYLMLAEANAEAFREAEALGWAPAQ